ncbi:hypothetical protein [Neolewinella agarilytica]|uniref:Uncharacterized protein n=1 Tax=Neolewinella agarilytica TaxID=478744 RepID=A0A1H9M7P4_9BACT|nr:hypothetical protein [Neolewinella agarilytica]SER19153.1 hypothetical protein SAMN05444359_12733 [Neolewinella agarilytica]
MIQYLVAYEIIHCHDGKFSRDIAVRSVDLIKDERCVGYHYDPDDERPIAYMSAYEVYIRVGLADPTDMSPTAELIYYAEPVCPLG